MKIFFVARGWPSNQEPQWGSFERDQALALKRLGHEVVILSFDSRVRKYHRHYGFTRVLHEEIPHYTIYIGAIWLKVLRSWSISYYSKIKNRFFLLLFNRVIQKEGMPDVMYAHYLVNSSMVVAVKKKYNIPIIGIEHWSELGYEKIKNDIRFWAKKTYKDLDCLISVSTALRENLRKNFGINSFVINNMVGHEFCYVPIERRGKIVRFVTTGNLLPVKGFDNLIKAFCKLNMSHDSWTLNIIGGGKERDNLQKLTDSVGLNNNIHLLGRKSRDGVIEMLHNSDVYVMSSRSETFGVAAIEALACGLPVIATECGGTADFMNEDNGITCPVDDVKGLANCISYMMNHYQEYNQIKIAEDCQNRFSSEAIGKQLEGIFEEVIRKNKKQ